MYPVGRKRYASPDPVEEPSTTTMPCATQRHPLSAVGLGQNAAARGTAGPHMQPAGRVKRCSSCHETKPASAFTASYTRPDGLQGYCRACDAARRRSAQVPAGPAAPLAGRLAPHSGVSLCVKCLLAILWHPFVTTGWHAAVKLRGA